MMPDFVFKIVSSYKISLIKLFGSKLNKLLLSVADEYYFYISKGVIHEEAITKIIKSRYIDDKKAIDDCRYFVFNRKQSIDSIYDAKYGKSGRFMSQLFKLVQKIYLDTGLDDKRRSYDEELNDSMLMLNKNFKKVVLYSHNKYDT
ncbi:MAG: hypothetical protein KIT33_06935 [Candidatus Kapabacteria bacterium]|nr:hypothetical protein [Ignavibacteriota bacterium]MCW5884690.1 hypothetical protein [Candidatus Kapabacteria bacterium]